MKGASFTLDMNISICSPCISGCSACARAKEKERQIEIEIESGGARERERERERQAARCNWITGEDLQQQVTCTGSNISEYTRTKIQFSRVCLYRHES